MQPENHNARIEPGRPLGRLARLMSYQAGLWRFCARRLYENNLVAMSSALSFRTIFALIPALVLAFLAAGALGFVEDSKRSLRAFLETSGFARIVVGQDSAVAATEPAGTPGDDDTSSHVINVADELEELVVSVQNQLTFRRIGPVGAALFIWTALSLIATMEGSLNRVFGAARSRSIPRRVLLYWSIMTLSPAALAITVYLGQRAIDIAQGIPGLNLTVALLGWVGPVCVGVVVLAAVYTLLPNTRVKYRAALGGALVAVLLWVGAKAAFGLYVERLVLKGNIYGILGAFPLFLMWLNFSWTIFLFGAELTHTAANLERLSRIGPEGVAFVGPSHALATTLAVARAFAAGRGPLNDDEILRGAGLSSESGAWLLSRLVSERVLCAVQGGQAGRYVLAQPPERIRVADVLAVGEPPQSAADAQTARLVALVRERMLASIGGQTLADVLAPAQARA